MSNAMTSSSTATHQLVVEGMTCEHCTTSVTEEISELSGVRDVAVDLSSGQLTVSGDVTRDAIAAAVDAAGYRVVSR
jgi:copper chaperone